MHQGCSVPGLDITFFSALPSLTSSHPCKGMLRLSDSLGSGPLLAALDNLVSREGFEAAMAANEYEQARRGLARALKTSLEKKGAGKAARRAIDELHGEQVRGTQRSGGLGLFAFIL